MSTVPGDRSLTVVHGEHFSQRDCITNRQLLAALFKDKAILDSLEEKTSWVSALLEMDKEFHCKLSKHSTDGQRKAWADIEIGNIKGLYKYFSEKLCKSTGSPNTELRELKKCYFELFPTVLSTAERSDTSVGGGAPGASTSASSSASAPGASTSGAAMSTTDMEYPSGSEDEQAN